MPLFRRRPAASIPAPSSDPLAVVTAWHERTKHHGHRYAAALGYLDWDNQPDPFRRYVGAPLLPLPRPQLDTTPPYESIYGAAASPAPRPLSIESLSELLYFSLALSAWKRHGDAHWSLRVNPSSGNLHPTEGWLLLPPLSGLPPPSSGLLPAGAHDAPGLFHYAPREHALEERARWPLTPWNAMLAALATDAPSQAAPASCFLVALSSIPWREAWKYGERAWRYCQHDVGHALAALRISAAMLGWSLTCLSAQDDGSLAALLGLDRAAEFPPGEPEHPDLLAFVSCGRTRSTCGRPPRHAIDTLARSAQWSGSANPLSADHHEWEAIAIAEATCRKLPAWSDAQALVIPPSSGVAFAAGDTPVATPVATPVTTAAALSAASGRTAGAVIRARRSAVAMDGSTGLTARGFCAMLERLVPALTAQPWDAQDWEPLVSLALFVHRVQDVDPGLYALVRAPRHAVALRAALDAAFVWRQSAAVVAAAPALPLFLLRAGSAQNLATAVSCGQDIAGRGAFSLGMLAEFTPAVARHGAPVYRHMFWETGMIGQVLYLEAEAAGIASTGIGCFFDDATHQALGLRDRSFQSLYHFTVGGAVLDTRLTTEPAYPGPGVP